ncbi:hypothetical protein WA026_011459 [Henosepilachna vigintioctopunctata]|uniref:Peptidase S1 domain-containing protein n=1 Tax=Henosepilachna vigintioctopunctata TaxID=420089 RepID=A0AAW1TLX1_9CUCU
MVQLVFILLPVILTLSGGTCETSASGRIYGGYLANIEKFPYIVSLQTKHENQRPHFCGGAIITSRFVITAAHCVDKITKEKLRIKAGTTYLKKRGITSQIDRIIIHPKWNGHYFDFALLKLHKPLIFSDRIRNVKLPPYLTEVPIKLGTATGWGLTNNPKDDLDFLRAVDLKVVEDCLKAKKSKYLPAESEFCAEHRYGIGDTCSNDSGGPFVIDGVLYGITSHGNGTFCQMADTGVYAKVPFVMNWIMKNIRQS